MGGGGVHLNVEDARGDVLANVTDQGWPVLDETSDHATIAVFW